MERYNFKIVEEKWQKYWEKEKTFSTKTDRDKKKFFEDISNQKVKDELKSLTDKAFQNDVFGAPTFIVNNKLFWGQDRLEYALEECVS